MLINFFENLCFPEGFAYKVVASVFKNSFPGLLEYISGQGDNRSLFDLGFEIFVFL